MPHDSTASAFKLRRAVNVARDHVRGGDVAGAVTVVVYADYLCPYCRRLRRVLNRLRCVLGPRLQFLGVREGPQRSARDVLLDTLRDRELLLVLDNCEHLIATCAELIEALLRRRCGFSRQAAKRSECPARPSVMSPRYRCRRHRHRFPSTRSSTPRPHSSSSSVRPRSLRARALIGLTHMHHFQGHSFAAAAAEALSLGREEGDAWVISFALFMQEGLAALECGDYEQANARSVEAREAANVCGDEVQHAGPLLILGNIAALHGDYNRAQQLCDEATVERHAGEIWGLSILLSAAAGLRILRQDFDQARAQATEALSVCEELEDPRGIAWSLEVFAGLLAAGGGTEGAARLWGTSDRLLESLGGSLTPEIRWIRTRYIEPVKTVRDYSRRRAPRGARCRSSTRLRSRVSRRFYSARFCAHESTTAAARQAAFVRADGAGGPAFGHGLIREFRLDQVVQGDATLPRTLNSARSSPAAKFRRGRHCWRPLRF
jgi:hypothetical protein